MSTALDTDTEEELCSHDNKEGRLLLGKPVAMALQMEGEKVSGKAWGRVKNIFTRGKDYPGSVFFILGNEFCERFSYYGMRAVLILYLTKHLDYNDNDATGIFHALVILCYFTPALGAVMADGYLGRYRTILYLSVVYALGNLLMALTALPPPERVGPMFGLLFIGLGTGGIKPNVSAFGADQFSPQQEKERNTFFSAFYFFINMGSVLSIILTPILRADVRCFGEECYPLAFGIPAILMLLSLIIFVSGRHLYKVYPPVGSVFSRTFGCIWVGVKGKMASRRTGLRMDHWLDYAEKEYEPEFVDEVKCLLRVLFMFIPLPLFWALSDQQGSRWTLQAAQLDGDMGALGRLKPDQLSALNPLIIIFMVPVFEKVIYPLCDRCHIPNRPLQRMVAGLVLTVIAFILAGCVQMKINSKLDQTQDPQMAGTTFINTYPCDVKVNSSFYSGTLQFSKESPSIQHHPGQFKVTVSPSCAGNSTVTKTFVLAAGTTHQVIIVRDNSNTHLVLSTELRRKPGSGDATVRFISTLQTPSTLSAVEIKLVPETYSKQVTQSSGYTFTVLHEELPPFVGPTSYQSISPGRYQLYLRQFNNDTAKILWINTKELVTIGTGAVYTVFVYKDEAGKVKSVVYDSVTANTFSIFWMVPQYVFISVGEIPFSITGLAFAYSQAPSSMKSVVQAAWLMTVAFGSLIVLIVAESSLFTSRTAEFFFFAALMAVMTIVFSVMSCFYKYRPMTVTYDVLPEDSSDLLANGRNEESPLNMEMNRVAQRPREYME